MDWRNEFLEKELLEKCDFNIENICSLAQFDIEVSQKVLTILLEWACYSQNEASIKLGRNKISEIPKDWLSSHLLNIVTCSFDYSDDWNYRRLLELVVELLPDNKAEFIELNWGTANVDLKEVIDDFM